MRRTRTNRGGPELLAHSAKPDLDPGPVPSPAGAAAEGAPLHFVISGTSFWNPGDDFVREGVIQILRQLFAQRPLNFLFYNFNADLLPLDKLEGISNCVAAGDLVRFRDHIDGVIVAGLAAGEEIKDLYWWVIEAGLLDRVYLIGGGYESDYVAYHVSQEPEATIFPRARIVIGRTAKVPPWVLDQGIPYLTLPCPALLSAPQVKEVPAGRRLQRLAFSVQLPHGDGLPNHSCPAPAYQLAMQALQELAGRYAVELIAHHKSEYFHFLAALRGRPIPVHFSSFYHDLFGLYPRYDAVITTRLHAALFANSCGLPAIVLNDTDRHTHALVGVPHSRWVNSLAGFRAEFNRLTKLDLAQVAREANQFKAQLLGRYLAALRPAFERRPVTGERRSVGSAIPSVDGPRVRDVVAYGPGCHAAEGIFRWLDQEATLYLNGSKLTQPVTLWLRLSCGDLWCYGNRPFRVRVSVGADLPQELTFTASQQAQDLAIRLKPGEVQPCVIRSEAAFVPSQLTPPGYDRRRLAVKLSHLRLEKVPPQ